MSIYIPTWLYVKKHNKTGLKYFGKTTSNDPIKYLGSGKYWQLHLKKHGNDVSTMWCHLYIDKDELVEDALSFSKFHNIVNSDEWANLKPETGIDGGGLVGRSVSEDTKIKIGNANRGRKMSEEFCQMRSAAQTGKEPWNKGKTCAQVGPNTGRKFGTRSDEYRKNMSNMLKGKPKPPRSKEHSSNISKAKLGQGHPQSDSAKQKIGEKNAGRRRMHNDELGIVIKMVPADQIAEFLLNGWKFNRNLK